ncbi:MAG: hypothetical protein J7M38_02340 [Armatimonadetes bacterium]|nr:hypothetical protein [Armatimonadota bacterium]
MRHISVVVGFVCVAASITLASPLRIDFSPPPLERVLARSGDKAQPVEVPRCVQAPQVDGDLSDAAWQSVADIQWPSGASGPDTRAMFCCDDAAIYVGVVRRHSPARPPAAGQHERDGKAWADDCIELWLDPAGDGVHIYQFVVNAAGSIYDQESVAGPAWNPDWQHAVTRSAGSWTVEMAIPAAAIGLSEWRRDIAFNIGCNGPELQPLAWRGEYAQTEAGLLRLAGIAGEDEERVQVTGPPLALGADTAVARPGERWIELPVTINPGDAPLARMQVTARLTAGGRTVAEATAIPSRPSGRVRADLRTLAVSKATLVVELAHDGTRLAQARAKLSARVAEPLPAGKRIEVRLDLPEGVDAVRRRPVTFGVPFPEGSLWDISSLRVVNGAGRPIPYQAEVAARWAPEGAVRWVRFDALVTSGEGCFVEVAPPGGVTDPQVTVQERDGEVFLDTGAAPIHSISTGGKMVATSEGSRGLYVTDQRGRTAGASAEGETMIVEARGPVAACVRFEGPYLTADGEELARHITRVEVFAGRSYADITHTLVLTRDTNEVWLTDIGWELAANVGDDTRATFATSRADPAEFVTVPLTDGGPVWMLQDRHYALGHGGNHFAIPAAGVEGEECGDWAALSGDDAGLLISCRDAALQHPKEFELAAGRVNLHLFSPRAGDELDFRPAALAERWDLLTWYDAVIPEVHRLSHEEVMRKMLAHNSNAVGWAKTHHLMFAPLATGADMPQRAARLSRLHSTPVYALADPDWICSSGAMGPVAARDSGRFPEIERAIDATIRQWHAKIPMWGDYGFVDYYAGPHLSYKGKYVNMKRYSHITYTFKPDLWLMYARSGDRETREFISRVITTESDGCMAHWNGPHKMRGLFMIDSGSDLPTGGVRKGQLPFFWESATYAHISSSSNVNNWAWMYYLTGDRRARDVALEYFEGLKRWWTPAAARRNARQLVLVRMLNGGWAMTWDPELRALADATMDCIADPDAELGYTQNRSKFDQPASTLYKTQVDIRALIEIWRTTGDERYHRMALKTARYWWQRSLAKWPLFYTNPLGVAGSLLYYETGDLRYPQAMLVQMRQAASAYDPETGKMSGVESAEKTTWLFEGTAHAERVLRDAGYTGKPLASWAAWEDFGMPSGLVFHKPPRQAVAMDLVSPGDFKIVGVREPDDAEGRPWIVEESYGNRSIAIPAGAPAGDYRLVPGDYGLHFVVANAGVPMVIYAPDYWRPAPAQAPAVPYYFRIPEDATRPAILFEGSAQVFDPSGKPLADGEALHGWVDLPADRPGLWSFLPVDNQLVKVRNLPPFFAVESAEMYFEPDIPWQVTEPQVVEEISPDTRYVTGAVNTPGNQALYLGGKHDFRLDGGQMHPSGDGRQLLPMSEGTIEFWFRPSWNTVDLPLKTKTILALRVASGDAWYVSYLMAERNRNAWLDFVGSHVLYAHFYTDGPKKRITMRTYRRTVFEANEWVHVAWVWGPRDHTRAGHETRLCDNVLVTEIYINGRRGQQWGYRWKDNKPADLPSFLHMYQLDAAVDELRISDIQRYREDFEPPSRDAEFALDEHTRALMHFNGDLSVESYGLAGTAEAVVK